MGIQIHGLAPLLQVFAFYQDVLGFELLESRGPPKNIGWVLLRHSGVQVMLNTAYERLARSGRL